jgi:magnesium-transporting ATPase (P-type)
MVVLQTHWTGEKRFQILQVHEFDSSRKYMSVILKGRDCVQLLVKGANRVVYDMLDENEYNRVVKGEIANRIHALSSNGLRLLVWGAKTMPLQQYEEWISNHSKLNGEYCNYAKYL